MLKDLRSFLKLLEEKGDLVHIPRPVAPRFDIAAGIRKTSEIQGPALWFDNVSGFSMPVVGGLYAVRRRLLWGLETSETEWREKFRRGLNDRIAPRLIKTGPCKEVILTGRDVDLGKFPICIHNRKDAGPYITVGLGFVRHPQYGNNVSISRIQVLDSQTAAIRAVQQLGVYVSDAEKRGEPLQLAVTIGNDPYVTVCSQVYLPVYEDELGVAGGWMGEPVELVQCETIDVAVPATSEIVLEGEILPGDRHLEGPFGEFPGYYQGIARQPIFRIKAITHRRDPIYLTVLTGRPVTENHILAQVPTEGMLYERVRQICPSVRDVCLTNGGAMMHAVISMRPTYSTQARDVILAALSVARLKLVMVVDDDIDVRNPDQVEWAIATRFQADRDLIVIPRQRGMFLDPSTPALAVTAIMGIDATRPFGEEFAEVADVPGAEDFVIPGWTDRQR
jgi:4-hydroxy-3-polyprenylbenzoate decarboxylase/2,5-furandicarboxylate decarboxylase 1